ncbi:carbonic anhydrase [Malaciobacter molluscorum]|uniref:carbonic anhydrase n=1 Tax=Malaciobacter molluscorum TaxID=1032072 RepID=UPI00100A6839|nr:carbonic anhydrase [Malaciobacter molluscorum]RXJ95092.1 carbonic anhydrase [Malaciobacter molluscorum]
MKELIKGNKRFREKKFPLLKENVKKLVKEGQKPEVLFIGCSDSRVTPDIMLDINPGDMFILRNVGNFVPPFKCDEDYHGSAAAIEYAVSVLNVKHIIVCGHSHCGACQSLYIDIPLEEQKVVHVKKWLELGYEAKKKTLSIIKNKDDKEKLYRLTEKISVTYQLKNLLTYPDVKRRLENGSLQIHGWYYKLEDGTIECYDQKEEKFKLLEECEDGK